MKKLGIALTVLLAVACAGEAPTETTAEGATPTPEPAPAIAENASEEWQTATADLERLDGFVTIYRGVNDGRVLAAFPAPGDDGVALRAIHAAGLSAGLGSNPIGLDRGLFNGGAIVAFRRIGGKVIAEQENWNYRASSDNPLEQRAVRESFAPSYLWATDILVEGANGELLVDISGFLTRDALDIRATLKNHPKGGTYSIASDRSFVDPNRVLVFPDNVEFDANLTLTSDNPGREVVATAADGRAITLVQHHSLVRLPDDDYTPRMFDQRSGTIDVPFYDFSAPLNEKIKKSYARRFRLKKETPGSAPSPATEPIVFYVDAGAPEQVRNALIDGALWWADAFEAAGFQNAYRVELLPDGAHPRDIRYNIIQWTHRQTRGWSYGGGVSDPRTGEMLKASVILGSQRVRQDRMIFEGLAGAGQTGSGSANDPVEIALARIRQLSAHEVGHTLGFAHNFAASSNDRASVMDYPAPYIRIGDNGALDFSEAYGVGIGDWDKLSATWLYAEFDEGADETAELNSILDAGYGSGLRFVGDREGRSVGTGHPYGSVWDNGEDAVAVLEETMRVREIALREFSDRSIIDGQPVSDLRQVIVPIYLYHRYQVAAASKLVGGYAFTYNIKGDNLQSTAPVPDAHQRRALTAIVETLDPAVLVLPDNVLDQMGPALGGFGALAGGGEVFDGNSEPMFDIVAAADAAGTISMSALLHPARAARLVEFERRNPTSLGLDDVMSAIETKVFADPGSSSQREISRTLQNRYISLLIDLSLNEQASAAVRSHAETQLRALAGQLAPGLFGGPTGNRDHNAWLLARINAHLNRPASAVKTSTPAPDVPPGSPIGTTSFETCWHCDPAP